MRGDQDGVDPQGGGAAEGGPHVGVVHQVLQDGHPPGALSPARGGQQIADTGQLRPVHGRQGAAVQVEAGDGLQHLLRRQKHGHLPAVIRSPASRGSGDDGPHLRIVALGHEEGTRDVPGGHSTGDDLGGLGHVQAPIGLQAAAQGHIGQAGVVIQALIGAVGEADDHGRGLPAESRPRLTMSSLRSAAGSWRTAGPENWLW